MQSRVGGSRLRGAAAGLDLGWWVFGAGLAGERNPDPLREPGQNSTIANPITSHPATQNGKRLYGNGTP